MAGNIEDALTDFPDPLAHYSETNAAARLFESCSGALRAPNSAFLGGRRPPLQLFLSCVASDQLALCDYVTLHSGVDLAPLCTRTQIQFAIESENFERIPMRAWRRTRTLVT